MKIKDFPVVKEASRLAQRQFMHYNEIMNKEIKTEEIKMSELKKKKLFIVDTISTFRHRYAIEANELEHAYDEVTMVDSGLPADAFESVSQRHLGEIIIDGREITKKEFDKMLVTLKSDKDEMSSYWMGDELIRKVNYDI